MVRPSRAIRVARRRLRRSCSRPRFASSGANLWVADSGNNRVLMFPPPYGSASKVLGQLDFGFNSPNLIEGRELFIYDPLSRIALGGMAVDTHSNPPHLYISDGLNNRILGFRDARNVKPGDKADMVIGQPDLFSGSPNFQTRDTSLPSDASLSLPDRAAGGQRGRLCSSPIPEMDVSCASHGPLIRTACPAQISSWVSRRSLSHVPDPSSSTMSHALGPRTHHCRLPCGLRCGSQSRARVQEARRWRFRQRPACRHRSRPTRLPEFRVRQRPQSIQCSARDQHRLERPPLCGRYREQPGLDLQQYRAGRDRSQRSLHRQLRESVRREGELPWRDLGYRHQ